MERPNAWLTYSDADMQDLETVAKKYRHFLNVGKTERECITQIVKEAEEAGYVSLEEKVKNGEDLKAGDKVYQVGMQKIIALYHIGEDDLAEGMNILCAHIDSQDWILNRIRYMRIPIWLILTPITMAVLRNISGLPFRWQCTV